MSSAGTTLGGTGTFGGRISVVVVMLDVITKDDECLKSQVVLLRHVIVMFLCFNIQALISNSADHGVAG